MPWLVDHQALHAQARRVLDTLQIDLDVRTPVHRLGVAQQQMVEIAKALSQKARVLVMDEPTAAISDREIERALRSHPRASPRRHGASSTSRTVCARSSTIGDRITVLRDGQRVADVRAVRDDHRDDLVRMMVGREVEHHLPADVLQQPGETILETRKSDGSQRDRGHRPRGPRRRDRRPGWPRRRRAHRGGARDLRGRPDRLRRGSAARRRLVRAGRTTSVERGHRAGPGKPQDAGAGAGRTACRTTCCSRACGATFRAAGTGAAQPLAGDGLIEQLRVATPSPQSRRTKFLSGGNQQKVVIGKWLGAGSRLYIFDEPTRGIDVGAKAEIYGLIEQLVAQGRRGADDQLGAARDRRRVRPRLRACATRRSSASSSRTELTEERILRLAMHHA